MNPSNPDPSKKNPVEDTTEYICQCFQVTEATIKAHIRNDRLSTIEQITAACEAGGGCQSCHMLLQLFLDEFHRPAVKPPGSKDPKPEKKGFLGRLFSRSGTVPD